MAKTKATAGKWGKEASRRYLEMSACYTGGTGDAPTMMECVIGWNRKKYRPELSDKPGSISK